MFGKRLKMLRIDKGLDQKELGAILNVTKQTISGYERDYRVPPPEMLSALADFFEVSTDFLLGRTDERIPVHELKKKIFDASYIPKDEDLEKLLLYTNIWFHGEKLDLEDKKSLLEIAKILWEKRRSDK